MVSPELARQVSRSPDRLFLRTARAMVEMKKENSSTLNTKTAKLARIHPERGEERERRLELAEVFVAARDITINKY